MDMAITLESALTQLDRDHHDIKNVQHEGSLLAYINKV